MILLMYNLRNVILNVKKLICKHLIECVVKINYSFLIDFFNDILGNIDTRRVFFISKCRQMIWFGQNVSRAR